MMNQSTSCENLCLGLSILLSYYFYVTQNTILTPQIILSLILKPHPVKIVEKNIFKVFLKCCKQIFFE